MAHRIGNPYNMWHCSTVTGLAKYPLVAPPTAVGASQKDAVTAFSKANALESSLQIVAT